MDSMKTAEALFPLLGVRANVPARDYTSFRIGGPMAWFAEPSGEDELSELIYIAKREGIPVNVIGNGSNLLVSDEGVDELFIRIADNMADFSISDNILTCGAGALLSTVARASVSASLMGLEWAAGIPGTVGGGCAMNAGAYGGEIRQVLRKVTVLEDGVVKTKTVGRNELGYRRSSYAWPGAVVIGAVMELQPDDGGARERMNDYNARRRAKQPLEYPSAGSTFKRPEGYFAGALIEQAGLKGCARGGAMVSPKHAGFIVNTGGATFSDVVSLIEHVRCEVYDRFGVMLEPEVKIIK